MENENQTSVKDHDPSKIHLPEFDPTIFTGAKDIGNDPKKIIEEIEIHPGEVVADFGCGVGFFVIESAELVGSNGKVIAIDIDRAVLDSVKTKSVDKGLRNVYGVLTDLEKKDATGLTAGSCDLVLMINILYLIKNRKAVMDEAYRVLRPGGRIAIMEWKEKGELLAIEKDQVVVAKELREITKNLNLRKIKTFSAGLSHEVNIFIK